MVHFLFFFFFAELFQNVYSAACPSGFLDMGTAFCLKFMTSMASYDGAQAGCAALSAELAYPLSDGENAMMRTYATNNGGSNSRYYLGMDDKDVLYTWESTSGAAITYTSWNTGEPNNAGSGGERCAEVNSVTPRWNDIKCTDSMMYYCQVARPTDAPTFVPTAAPTPVPSAAPNVQHFRELSIYFRLKHIDASNFLADDGAIVQAFKTTMATVLGVHVNRMTHLHLLHELNRHGQRNGVVRVTIFVTADSAEFTKLGPMDTYNFLTLNGIMDGSFMSNWMTNAFVFGGSLPPSAAVMGNVVTKLLN
jgi:hypothetical protein